MAGRSKTQANRRAARFIVRPLFAALCASGIVAPLASHAATIPVTTGGDAGTGATCTLRQAVESLNTATLVGTSCTNTGVFGSFDSVDLLAQAGTIALAGAAEIPISVDMQFSGPGATTLTISGANASRVFNISGPRAVGIDALTIANGLSAGPGGCIAGANAQLSLTGSVVTGCTALPDPLNLSFLDGLGGGIATYGVYLNHSTVSANTAANAGGGIWGKYITAYGSVVANNTVTGAACDIEAGGPFCVPTIFGGGGILTGAVQLINSTVSGNTVNASAFTSLNGEPPVPQTYLIGIGGGITHISKYDFEELALAKAGVTRGVFGNRDPAIRAAARAQAKGKFAAVRAKARSKIGGKGTLRNKADGYGYYILAMFGSTVSGNRVTGDKSAPGKYAGGGIAADGKYYNNEIANSTISGNSLDPAGVDNVGAAIFADGAELTSSTITGNTGANAAVFKYGLPVVVPETAKSAKRAAHPALNAMIASGRAKVAAFRQDARMKAGRPRMKSASDPILYSTIIGGNGGAFDLECSNCIITGSDNLVQRVEPSTTVPLDTIVNQNPQLGPLAANGGFMNGASGHPLTGVIRTHLLFSDSPAIDRGSNPEGFSYDQRGFGFQRVVGGRADIGAIEGMLQRNNVPVPVVGPWLVALLSALVGVLGLRSRRRKA